MARMHGAEWHACRAPWREGGRATAGACACMHGVRGCCCGLSVSPTTPAKQHTFPGAAGAQREACPRNSPMHMDERARGSAVAVAARPLAHEEEVVELFVAALGPNCHKEKRKQRKRVGSHGSCTGYMLQARGWVAERKWDYNGIQTNSSSAEKAEHSRERRTVCRQSRIEGQGSTRRVRAQPRGRKRPGKLTRGCARSAKVKTPLRVAGTELVLGLFNGG